MKLSFFVWENLTGRSSSSLYWRNFKVSTLDYDNKWTLRFRKQWTIAGGRFRGNDVSFKEFLSEIGTLLSGGFYSKIGLRLSTRLVYNVMVNNVSLCSFGYAFDDVWVIVKLGWIIYCLVLVLLDCRLLYWKELELPSKVAAGKLELSRLSAPCAALLWTSNSPVWSFCVHRAKSYYIDGLL